MSLKRLACLVLAVVLGTAFSVQSYLEAARGPSPAARIESQQVAYPHAFAPLRADPARRPFQSANPAKRLRSLAREDSPRPAPAAAPLSAPVSAPDAPAASTFRGEVRQ